MRIKKDYNVDNISKINDQYSFLAKVNPAKVDDRQIETSHSNTRLFQSRSVKNLSSKQSSRVKTTLGGKRPEFTGFSFWDGDQGQQ